MECRACAYLRKDVAHRVFVLFVALLCYAPISLFSQCVTESTNQFTAIGQETFTASIGSNVTVEVDIETPGFSALENVSTTTTLTNQDPTWYSENVAGNVSLQLRLVWDLTAINQLDDLESVADDRETGFMRLTFSEPINCPTLHFDRIGGGGSTGGSPTGVSNSASFTVITPGVTLQQPPGSGTDDFIVTPTSFFKQPDVPNTNTTASGSLATQGVTTGSAAGSVKLISSSPITFVEFEWTGVGVEGIGADELEIVITGQPDCFPEATLEKFVDDVRILPSGQFEVDYFYLLENAGDTSLLNISLLDDFVTSLGCAYNSIVTGPNSILTNNTGNSILPTLDPQFDGEDFTNMFIATDGVLQPGDQIETQITILLDPSCEGVNSPLVNTAVVQGADPFGNEIEVSDEASLFLSRISITKTADVSEFSNPIVPGDIIRYAFEICNTGSSVLQNIQVDDPLPNILLVSFPFTLGPGECNNTSVTGLYTLTTQDLINGMVSNQATVTATDEEGIQISDLSDDPLEFENEDPNNDGDPDDPTVVFFEATSAISISKFANTSQVQNPTAVGDIITYQFEVCNTGSLPLSNLTVTDPLVTISGFPISLQPGLCNITTFSGSLTITQQDIENGLIANTATVSADTQDGDTVTDQANVDVFLNMAPQVELTKRAITTNIQNPTAIDDLIIYEFEICNTGNVALINVQVDDPLLSISGLPITLGIGECNSTNFTANYFITAADLTNLSVTNSATVTASNGTGIIVSDVSDDPDSVDPGDEDPTIVALFECQLAIGQLSSIPDQCIGAGETVTLGTNQLTSNTLPSEFEVLYLLSTGLDQRIVAVSSTPDFQVNITGAYAIHVLIAETSNPLSSSFLNPSVLIPGAILISELQAFITQNSLCSLVDPIGVEFLVSEQPVVELLPSFTICNSDELLLPTVVVFDELFSTVPIDGIWTEPTQNISVTDSLDFTGFTSGAYVFTFNSTNAIDPCVNVSESIVINVIDCFSECDELVCNENITVSLGDACFIVPTEDQLLESPVAGVYTLEFSFENGMPYSIDTIRSDVVGETLVYTISCAGNSCWGNILVEANNIPFVETPCACSDNTELNPACVFRCLDENEIPDALISTEEYLAVYSNCGPPIIGDLIVSLSQDGDVCSPQGIRNTLVYSAKIERHGAIEDVELMCQTFWEQKLDIGVSDVDFFSNFGFPGDVQLNCNDIDANVNPEIILEITGEDSLSFPFFIDKQRIIQDSVIVQDTQFVVLEEFFRDTTVFNEDGEWELVTIQEKIVDTIVSQIEVPNGLAINPIVAITDQTCNILVSFADTPFEACGSSFKVVRTWTLVDWCDNAIERSLNQNIEVVDTEAPSIIRTTNETTIIIDQLPEVQVGIDPWVCTATVRLPELELSDNCDDNPQFVWITDHGTIRDGFALGLPLEFSPAALEIFIEDDCGNAINKELSVVITDNVPPVALAQSELLISLAFGNPGNDAGEAKIFAQDLDEGSHDNGCGKVTLKAVRADDWEDAVRLCTGELAGFEPSSSAAITELVDIGFQDDKGDCIFDGSNLVELIVEPGEFVKFDCDDLNLDFEVILFVCDEAGNRNEARTSVFVSEESTPTLECDDIDFRCSDIQEEEDIEFEPPSIIGSACFNPFLRPQVASERRINGACGAAEIFVEWFLDLDNSGDPTFGDPMCTQVVTVETEGEILDPSTIKWPTSRTGETVTGINIECNEFGVPQRRSSSIQLPPPMDCVPEVDELEGPVWCDSDCGIVGVSVETDTLAAEESCLTLIRRWTVIDWCLFTPNDDDEPNDSGDSFIAIEDWAQAECPTGDCIEFGPFVSETIFFSAEPDTNSVSFTNPFLLDVDGFYTYDQVIKIVDTTAPSIEVPDTIIVSTDISGNDQGAPGVCLGSGIVTVSGEDFCNREVVPNELIWSVEVLSAEGELINDVVIMDPILGISASTGIGSAGESRTMIWTASDGCGNVSRDTTLVIYADQEPPVPACVSALSTSFDSISQSVTVWADELVLSSYDNCTISENLRLSILQPGQDVVTPADVNFNRFRSVDFSCIHAGDIIDVFVWIFDESNNSSFCETSIFIQSSDSDCSVEDSVFDVSGSAFLIDQRPIPDAIISIDSDQAEYPKVTDTDQNGNFMQIANPSLQNYTINATKEDAVSNGMSTADLVLLQQHIIGLKAIESPYLLLAGDANNDERLTAADVLTFRRIILGLDESSELDSWIFIPEAYTFLDNNNPWPYASTIEIEGLIKNENDQNFIGVKIGDVNNDVKLDGTETRNVSQEDLFYTVTKDKDKLIVEFSLDKKLALLGFQFKINHSSAFLSQLNSGIITINDNQFFSNEEETAISWSNPTAHIVESEDILFTMVLESDHSNVSLAFIEDFIEAELYSKTATDSRDLILKQKYNQTTLGYPFPNPSTNEVIIPFELVNGEKVNFNFYDLKGRLLYQRSGNFTAGHQSLTIEKAQLKINSNQLILFTMNTESSMHYGRIHFVP